jgi:hypothetical protein
MPQNNEKEECVRPSSAFKAFILSVKVMIFNDPGSLWERTCKAIDIFASHTATLLAFVLQAQLARFIVQVIQLLSASFATNALILYAEMLCESCLPYLL